MLDLARVDLGFLRGFREGIVDGDQLGAVRERGLHLNVLDHLWNAVHHLAPAQQLPARVHDVADCLAGTRLLKDVHGQQGHHLGVIEEQATATAPLRHVSRHMDQQALLLVRSQMHDEPFLLSGQCMRPGMPKDTDTEDVFGRLSRASIISGRSHPEVHVTDRVHDQVTRTVS